MTKRGGEQNLPPWSRGCGLAWRHHGDRRVIKGRTAVPMADNPAPRSGKGRQSSAADRTGRATAGAGRAGTNGARALRAEEVAPGVVQAKIEIPSGHPLVSVFGAGDGLLRVIEKAFPGVDIHARGNQVTIAGSQGEVGLVERLFEEMLLMLRTGAPLT